MTLEEKIENFAPVKDADARYTDEDKIFFFEWNVGKGHTAFGMHGTEDQWLALQKLNPEPRGRILRKKQFICTGKEQKQFAREQARLILTKPSKTEISSQQHWQDGRKCAVCERAWPCEDSKNNP